MEHTAWYNLGMEIDFINQWHEDETFNSFSLIEISYDRITLGGETQHTIALFLLGLGFYICWDIKHE